MMCIMHEGPRNDQRQGCSIDRAARAILGGGEMFDSDRPCVTLEASIHGRLLALMCPEVLPSAACEPAKSHEYEYVQGRRPLTNNWLEGIRLQGSEKCFQCVLRCVSCKLHCHSILHVSAAPLVPFPCFSFSATTST